MAYPKPNYGGSFTCPRCRARTGQCYGDASSTNHALTDEDAADAGKKQQSHDRTFWKAENLSRKSRRQGKGLLPHNMSKSKIY
jgi:hypothetical protein